MPLDSYYYKKYFRSKKKMNNLIVFMLVTSMYFGLNEGWTVVPFGCEKNTLEFRNELVPGNILKVNCTSKDDITAIHDVVFNGKCAFRFGEHAFKRTIWKCLLRQGPKMEYYHLLWRAYRGASKRRCRQIRSWIAKVDGIYLEKNNGTRKRMFDWVKN